MKQMPMMKKVRFASARGSAILATLTEGISKLSGPRWVQKVDNLKSSRRNVSEIKLKRTDTTLDLSQKAKRAKEEKRRARDEQFIYPTGAASTSAVAGSTARQ